MFGLGVRPQYGRYPGFQAGEAPNRLTRLPVPVRRIVPFPHPLQLMVDFLPGILGKRPHRVERIVEPHQRFRLIRLFG